MKTRSKILLVNILIILFAIGLVIGGALLALHFVDNQSAITIDADELVDVLDKMDDFASNPNSEKAASVKALYDSLPDGYGVIWLYGSQQAAVHNLSESAIRLVLRRYEKGDMPPVFVCYGNVIISRSLGTSTVVAVKPTAYETRLTYILVIYEAGVTFALFVIFLANILFQNSFIFPKLDKLRHAMNEVYNGNYAQVVRLPHGKKPDDITRLLVEFDRLRRRLSDATKAKEDADRERGVMISGISHDLRTPLTVIQVHAKGLVDGVAQKMGKTVQYYDNIYSTACNMLSLVDKLAEFSKVETHTVTYSFIERDLGVVVQEYVNNHYIPYAARGLKIKLKLPKGRPLWVNLDKEQFLRVLQNICDNSLKYKDKETCTICISAEIRGDEVMLRLADDGPGIGDFEAEYIFESYYRGDPSRTNPISGSGLGLSIVKNIILAHKGQIVAYNNNGLTIEITLPYRRKK